MKNKYLRILIALFLVVCLIAVRFFENDLFYDPLIKYFRYYKANFPAFNEQRLYINIFFRYMLNLLLTSFMIKMIFWRQSYVRFTIIVGILFFIILLPLYAYQLKNHFPWDEMIFFYTRRFLIQPMLLIILIPCFYYQEIKNKLNK